ncbi:hypothetical protein CAC42_1067 [Sphaceloma murrayae]|uniref:Uncharacterized protein n=1 Tax=Sphaceloma murrayae TaxID=2082308 RepID=A0A2K1R1W9_9PEZI|nr:hypothetical protein CAC42_1067 [Sphaceloma murrayae]
MSMDERAKGTGDQANRKSDTGLDEDAFSDDEAPIHPVPAMQEAFEESIQEAADGDEDTSRTGDPGAEARRRELLDQPTYDASWTTRWKQRPSARCHPIIKLMSQIIFGLHLLYQRQAKSDAEVVKILQVHVDEIDAFLEKTTEDFDLAMKDIDERIAFLKLPMTHVEVFDVMLDDKKFRTQLIQGNDKIEKIIERTAKAMNAALLDIQKAVNTTQQLAEYLDSVRDDWPHDTPDQSAIFVAMKGNEEGWRGCLRDLQGKGHQLGVALVQLGTVVGEMSKLAAAASRRNAHQNSNPQSPLLGGPSTHTRPGTNSQSVRGSLENSDKPLPKEPDTVGAAVRATIPKAHTTTLPHKKSKSNMIAPSNVKKSNSILKQAKSKDTGRRRPTQMQPREPTSPNTSRTRDLAGFIKSTEPPSRSDSTLRPRASANVPDPAPTLQGRMNLPSQSRPQSPPVPYYQPVQVSQQPPFQDHYQHARQQGPTSAQQHHELTTQRPRSPPRHQHTQSQAQHFTGLGEPAPIQHMRNHQQQAPGPMPAMPQPTVQPILQYPPQHERPFHNALTAVAHRQTGGSKEPAPQEYTVTFERPPRAELDATPFPREVFEQPQQTFQQVPTMLPPPVIKNRAQVQQPTESQIQLSIQSPDRVQTVHTYDPRTLHRQMQERARLASDSNNGGVPQEHHATSQAHGLVHNVSTSSGSKVDSAYTLSSGKPPSEVASQSSSRAPSRLGLFPDTNITTPPQSSRAGSFTFHSPPPQSQAGGLSPSSSMHYTQPKATNKFSKFFKRKTKDQHSYVQVSPR